MPKVVEHIHPYKWLATSSTDNHSVRHLLGSQHQTCQDNHSFFRRSSTVWKRSSRTRSCLTRSFRQTCHSSRTADTNQIPSRSCTKKNISSWSGEGPTQNCCEQFGRENGSHRRRHTTYFSFMNPLTVRCRTEENGKSSQTVAEHN